MASLQVRIGDLITAIGTDIKLLRTYITGSSTGDLTGLTTTTKTSIIAAINEVKAASGTPSAASETVSGIAELATQAETDAGTDDLRIVTPLKFQTRMAAYVAAQSQPLDSDLTAIAALTTTAYGRAFLALANQAALVALLPAAAAGTAGILQIATQTEVNTGTDNTKAVTPLTYQTRLAAYAQPLNANLTALAAYTVETSTLGSGTTTIPNSAVTKAYIDALMDANNAMQYKGVIDCSTNPNYPAASAGWTYKVSVAGKIGGASGINVEVGDTLVCLVDSTAAGNQATVGANWNILQTNIDGAVVGPASSVSANIVTFSGTTGKIIADSGVSVSTDGTLATNNNTKVPTEGAIRTFLAANYYTQTQLGNPDTDLAAAYTTAKT